MIVVHYQNPKHTNFTTGKMIHKKKEFPNMRQANKWLESIEATSIVNVRVEIIKQEG